MTEWDGNLSRDGWYWLTRRRDGTSCMAFYSRVDGFWRVSDSIGRTGCISPAKVAKRFLTNGKVVPNRELQVVMIEDCGFYVPEPVKAEIERLRALPRCP